ncbi:hypothetical protein WDW37_21400 [Bdellovibrionota bacterium FG-1]
MTRLGGKREQRRKERANVENRLKGVYLKCEVLSPKEMKALNISELGIGVGADALAKAPAANEVLQAKLSVGQTVATVKVRLVHLSLTLAGFEFVHPPSLLKGAIRRYFEPELVGAGLRLVSSDENQQIFESTDGSRLTLSAPCGVLQRFSIRVLGTDVQWDSTGGLRLLQHEQKQEVPEFLRRQLVKLVQSADELEPLIQRTLENILLGVVT